MSTDLRFKSRKTRSFLTRVHVSGGKHWRNARKVTGAAAGGAQRGVGGGDSVNVASIPRRATWTMSTSHAMKKIFWKW